MVHVYVYPPRTGIRLSRSKYGPFSGGDNQKLSPRHISLCSFDGFPVVSGAETKEGIRHGD